VLCNDTLPFVNYCGQGALERLSFFSEQGRILKKMKGTEIVVKLKVMSRWRAKSQPSSRLPTDRQTK